MRIYVHDCTDLSPKCERKNEPRQGGSHSRSRDEKGRGKSGKTKLSARSSRKQSVADEATLTRNVRTDCCESVFYGEPIASFTLSRHAPRL